MPSRADKEKLLKSNYEQALARSKKDYKKTYGKNMPEKREKFEKAEFKKALKEADSQLGNVWNEKSNETETYKRPTFGTYFSGVNFDKEGKIIR